MLLSVKVRILRGHQKSSRRGWFALVGTYALLEEIGEGRFGAGIKKSWRDRAPGTPDQR
jgi:hypothetical protein